MKPFPFALPMLLDGATGTQLQKAGMPAGVCPEAWILDNPQALLDLQGGYRTAGSDAVLAPTFTANAINLTQHGMADRVAEMNRALVQLSRQAVGDDALVGADLTSTGKLLEPYGDVSFEDLYQAYLEQTQALEAAGVDFFIMETTTTLAEARAALLACRKVSQKPVLVSFTCDATGHTFTGIDVLAALVTIQAMGADAFGLNCSAGPDLMLPQLERLSAWAKVPLIAKPNAGLPETIGGKTVYRCTPEEFTAYVPAMAQAGVRIFGGCCGTTQAHIAALKQTLTGLALPDLAEKILPRFCCTERMVFPLTGEEPRTQPIPCTEDFCDDAMDAREDALFRVLLDSEDAVENFCDGCYAVQTPLCLVTGDAGYLEQALRAFQGIACVEASCGIDASTLQTLQGRYGLTILD